MRTSNDNNEEGLSPTRLEAILTGGVPPVVRLGEDYGKRVVENLLVAGLASLSGTAVAALGRERAAELLCNQLIVLEML